MRCTVVGKDKREQLKQLKEETVHWCCLMNSCPTSSTVIALEQWVESVVELVLQVVGVPNRTRTAQGHVAGREESVVGSVERATGLVPRFAY